MKQTVTFGSIQVSVMAAVAYLLHLHVLYMPASWQAVADQIWCLGRPLIYYVLTVRDVLFQTDDC